eukprot:3513205-Amphidinium_carterae.1
MAAMGYASRLMTAVNIELAWASPQCQWDAQLIANSRRVRGGASSWRARSDQEPGAASFPAKWRHQRFIVKVELATTRGSTSLLHWSKAGGADKPDKSESSTQPRSWAAVGKLTPWIDDNDPWALRRPKQDCGDSRPRSVPAVKRSRADARPVSGSPARRRVSWDSNAGSMGHPDEDDDIVLEQPEQHVIGGSDEQARMVLDAHEMRFARLEQMMTQLFGHLQGGLPAGPPGIPSPVVPTYQAEPKIEPPIGAGDAEMKASPDGTEQTS